jgi:hypothetical protein
MKKLFYSFIILFFTVNAIAGSVMLAEGEIIVLDTTASDVMPAMKSGMHTQTQPNRQSSMPDSIPDSSPGLSEAEPTKNEQIGYLKGSVSRSVFTSQVAGHEPIDKIDKLPSNNRSVMYFTELRDMSGQTAIHRWEFDGNVMAETKFKIAGPRWRVWSSKNLLPTWTGEWKVSVLNGVGEVISEDVFSYIEEDVAETAPQTGTITPSQELNGQQEETYTNDNLN